MEQEQYEAEQAEQEAQQQHEAELNAAGEAASQQAENE